MAQKVIERRRNPVADLIIRRPEIAAFRAVSMAIHQPQGLRPGLCCTAPLGLKPLILGYHIQTLLPLISFCRKTALSDCTRREDSP